MSHRGRGYSSSYRGSSSRGSWLSDSRSSRGNPRGLPSSYSSSRGSSFSVSRGPERSVGGRYWSGSSSSNGPSSSSLFETSRGRFSASTPNDSMRYSGSSRSHHSDEPFKRPYRNESSSFGSSRSPERKRIRSEVQGDRSPRALSSRHGNYAEYGANGTPGGSHRYESSGGGSSSARRYSTERRSSFTSERRPSSSSGFRPPPSSRHDDYRKLPSSPRGTYRGRLSARGLTRREAIFSARRRILDASSSSFVSRTLLRSVQRDNLRKLKLAKLRSSRRLISSRKFSSRVASRRRSSEKLENWDEDEKKADKSASSADKTSSEKKKIEDKSDTEKSKKSPKINGEASSPVVKKESEKDGHESSDNEPRSRYTGRKFIRLTCVHCGDRCVTFKEYSTHLQRSRHLAAMRRVAMKQKSVLSRMRILQRSKQRDLDKDDENTSSRKNFCLLCKLNYKQLKAVHQSSDAHKEMKRFLMPFCKVCRITFRSPMLYENHICSLDHIKRKAQQDSDEKGRSADGAGSGHEEINLDNFLTLDSVGDVDDEGEESDKKIKQEEIAEDSETSKNKKEPVNVGHDYIRKVEVLYCDLCRMYLTSATSAGSEERRAAAIKVHCRTRAHLKRYVRKTEDVALRETAERIHRSKTEAATSQKEKSKDKKEGAKTSDDQEKEGAVKDESKETTKPSEASNEEPTAKVSKHKSEKCEDDKEDEKIWAEVDKDLGDLLDEVEPGTKSSDEDEEKGTGERYDRFRYSEKGTVGSKDDLDTSSKLDESKGEKEDVECAKDDDEDDK